MNKLDKVGSRHARCESSVSKSKQVAPEMFVVR